MFSEKTLRKVHGRKRRPDLGLGWVSDRHADLHNTIKANSKIVKERIWTLDSPSRQQD